MTSTTAEVQIFNVVFSVALALLFARVFGHLLNRLRQPPVIGEILAGFLLGGFGLSLLFPELNYTSDEFMLLAEFGILFLMFISGLETSFSKLKKVQKPAILVAVGGVLVPLVLGILASLFFVSSWQERLIIGLILVATSVGVPVRVLMDLHALNTEVGLTILGAAVIDDVICIILFVSVFGVGAQSVVLVSIQILVFFLLFLFVGLKIIDKIMDLGERIQLPKALLSLSLAIFLIYSFFAYQSGIAGITGAFVAGIVIGHAIKSKKVVDDIKAIGYGLFIPLFFVWVGATVDPTVFSVVTVAAFAVMIIFIGIIGKIIGCGLGAKLAGMTNKHSLRVGIGMIPRLEMALIIAGTAVSHHPPIVENANQIIAITVLLTLVTTLITPFLLKVVFKKEPESSQEF
ncbi:MAG: cation:proton antiporter [Methanobacteriota archaeon]